MTEQTTADLATDPTVWDRLAAPFDATWIEKLPKQLRRDDQDKGRCAQGSTMSADGHFCGGWHARSVHLDYIGHAGITMRLNTVVGPGGWTLEAAATTEDGLPLMRGGEFWARLTVLGVTKQDLAANFNSTQEAWGDALRRTAMRFGIGTYLWAKSEYAAELATFREPDPSEDPAAQAQAYSEKLAEQPWPDETLANVETTCERAGLLEESVKFRGNTMTLAGAIALCRAENHDRAASGGGAPAPEALEGPQGAPQGAPAPVPAPDQPPAPPAGPQNGPPVVEQGTGQTRAEAAEEIALEALKSGDVEALRTLYRGSTDLLTQDVTLVVDTPDLVTLGIDPNTVTMGDIPLGGVLLKCANYVEREGHPVRHTHTQPETLPMDPWADGSASAGGPSS